MYNRNGNNNKSTSRSHLLGFGLDNDDGHKRLTEGEGFSILGGSEETHDKMTETVIKTCEDLKNKGKTIHNANPREIAELMTKNIPKS